MNTSIPDPYPLYVWPDGWRLVRALGSETWTRLIDQILPWGWEWDDTYMHQFTLWLLNPDDEPELVLVGAWKDENADDPKPGFWSFHTLAPKEVVYLPIHPVGVTDNRTLRGPKLMVDEHPRRIAVRHIYDVLLPYIIDGDLLWEVLATGGSTEPNPYKGLDQINKNPLWLPFDITLTLEELRKEDFIPRGRRLEFARRDYVFRPASTVLEESSQRGYLHTTEQMKKALLSGSVTPAKYLPWYLWARLSETWWPYWPYDATFYDDGRKWEHSLRAHLIKIHSHDRLYRAPGALWSGIVTAAHPVMINVYLEPPDKVRWEVVDGYDTALGPLDGPTRPASSYIGPLDALRNAQLVIASEEKEDWLERQAIPGEPTFPEDMYLALNVGSPMWWGKQKFLRWVEGMTEQDATSIRASLASAFDDKSY